MLGSTPKIAATLFEMPNEDNKGPRLKVGHIPSGLEVAVSEIKLPDFH